MSRHLVYWTPPSAPGVLYYRLGSAFGSEPFGPETAGEAARRLALQMNASTMESLNQLDRKQVQEVQNACNPVAVAGFLHQVARQLTLREDTNQIARHPEFRAVLLKLCDMAGVTDIQQAYQDSTLDPFWPEVT